MSYRFPPFRNPWVNRDRPVRLPASPLALLLALAVILCLGSLGCQPNLGASTRGWGSVTAANGVVYATTVAGQMYALDDFGVEGVGVRWTSTAGGGDGFRGAYNSPVVGRYVYVAGIDGFLYAFNMPAGGGPAEIAWRQPRVESEDMRPLVGSPGLDEAGGIVAVGSEDGGLYAYNALTGDTMDWPPFATHRKIWSTPVLRNGVAYFGSQNGAVYAVSLETGTELWRYETGGAIVAKPLIHQDILIVGSFDRQLYALDLGSGIPRWQHGTSNWWWATPAASGRTIYAAAMNGKVYALDVGTGTVHWEYDLGAPIVSSPVLLGNNRLVVATVDGKLSVLRASPTDHGTAQQIASLSLGNAEIKAPLVSSGSRVGPGGITQPADSVYVGSDDGKVYRVQVSSGINILWCYDTGENTRCN